MAPEGASDTGVLDGSGLPPRAYVPPRENGDMATLRAAIRAVVP